jgi:NADPH-dependent 2,4-dienoyl-CoA reductase/sulfur reductase-like enzyme/rhodanese-related sulfurtransferase
MGRNIVIIGGVAAGASAAAKARRVDEHAQIVLFERGPYVSFANCGLPYYIGGEITDREQLFQQTPEGFATRFRVDVRVLHEVLRIDRAGKRVEVRRVRTGETFSEPYDTLIVAPGAGAIVPPLPGIDLPNIFTVKTVPDSDAIKAFIDQAKPARAVVIGAGFIGLEAAEALAHRGLAVTVVELQPQVLPPFDADMARFVQQQLEAAGIEVILGDGLKAFHGAPRAAEVELQSGRRLPMDLAILSIGVRPELQLAKDAGLAIGAAGGIAVDERQQTSDPNIYAAGDATEVAHLVTGKKARIPLAGPANKQGRVAGANAAGGSLTFAGAAGTAIVETMGIVAAKTGLSEREAAQAGIQAYVSLTHSPDHAGYYPGSVVMHLKLVVEQEGGRLLGAQIVGERGVDKRIDVLATALAARMTVNDLEQLDLAYAPQFSSAKDPVVMAGFVAANVQTITCQELDARLAAGEPLQVVDVRTPAEHAQGHLPSARLVPIDALRDRVHELDPSRDTVVYCRVGLRGYLAARILQQHGFARVRNLTGGLLMCRPPAESPPTVGRAETVGRTGNGHISVAELREVIGARGSTVIDVREPDEYGYERVRQTRNIPLGRLAQAPVPTPADGPVYVLCQTGARSQQALTMLRQAGCADVRVVTGGLQAWKAAGYAVERSKGPLPIMRQVQIVAGSLVLLGALLPGAHWLAAFVGAGLVFAGVSGHCGMAMVLARLPWNKPAAPVAPPASGASSAACRPPSCAGADSPTTSDR